MKKLIYLTILYFIVMSSAGAGEKKFASFVTIVSTDGNSIDAEARNFAYMNSLKIVGTRVTKQGDNWVKTIKVISKD